MCERWWSEAHSKHVWLQRWNPSLHSLPPSPLWAPSTLLTHHLAVGGAAQEGVATRARTEVEDATAAEASVSVALGGKAVQIKQEHTPGMPYPLNQHYIDIGWDTMINKCWLRCADCECWRNVPKAVRDKVVAETGKQNTWTCGMATRWRDVRNPRRPACSRATRFRLNRELSLGDYAARQWAARALFPQTR
jgi:hypothetical protein